MGKFDQFLQKLRQKLRRWICLATEDDARAQLPPGIGRIEWARVGPRVPETDAERQQLRTGRLMDK